MQFKGTPRFPASTLDKAIARLGGYWNAYTHLDWTTYFETMPADKIELAIQLEADRMVNSTFDPAEVASERTVIISERQGSENEPLFQLSEAVQASAFSTHNYRHEVIGDLADLQTLQRDDLFSHYRTYYIPNNAVLAVAGDFEAQSMLEQLRQAYESIPSGQQPARSISPEPAQAGERQLTINGQGTTTYIEIAYHAPPATHPDFFPLMVADSLLSGAGSLNMFSAGLSNRTSRLYRALVERELAVSIHGGLQATIDPFLYSFTAIVHPESTSRESDCGDRNRNSAPDGYAPQPGRNQARGQASPGSVRLRQRECYQPGFLAGFLRDDRLSRLGMKTTLLNWRR